LATLKDSNFNPHKILVIDFGQLGDVVLSLPALRAVRKRFPHARLTVAVGKPGAEIVKLAGVANEVLAVDRVGLRDGSKIQSLWRIFGLVRDMRRAKYDFVIDLHSLSETNLLGFLSGAPKRLFSRRPPRSWDFLSNFEPRPPIESDHRQRHLVDRYLDVLLPLGVKNADREPRIKSRPSDDKAIDALLKKAKADAGAPLVGLFPGAGHPTRRWPVEKFAELADYLIRNDKLRVVLFLGPEEAPLSRQLKASFPKGTVVLDNLTVAQLAAAQARLAVFVSNDTGPMHIAAAVGTPVVVVLHKRAPRSYLPIGNRNTFISSAEISEISVDEVYTAARALFTSARADGLFVDEAAGATS
jgi:ADP-heptose:LPS heptosyltransferase